jgi:hypothetical protein
MEATYVDIGGTYYSLDGEESLYVSFVSFYSPTPYSGRDELRFSLLCLTITQLRFEKQ